MLVLARLGVTLDKGSCCGKRLFGDNVFSYPNE